MLLTAAFAAVAFDGRSHVEDEMRCDATFHWKRDGVFLADDQVESETDAYSMSELQRLAARGPKYINLAVATMSKVLLLPTLSGNSTYGGGFGTDFHWTSELVVTRDLTIRADHVRKNDEVGVTRATVVVLGGGYRVVTIASGAHLTLCNLDFQAGDVVHDAFSNSSSDSGGGVAFRVMQGGSLSVVGSSISGFASPPEAGAGAIHVESGGRLILTRSRILGNRASEAATHGGNGENGENRENGGQGGNAGNGGAIALDAGAHASLLDCELSNNSAAQGVGGAIASKGARVALRNVSLRDNFALASGAIHLRVLGETLDKAGAMSTMHDAGGDGGGGGGGGEEGAETVSSEVGVRGDEVAPLLLVATSSFRGNRATAGASDVGISAAPPSTLLAARPSSVVDESATAVAVIDDETTFERADEPRDTMRDTMRDTHRLNVGSPECNGRPECNGQAAIMTDRYPVEWQCHPRGYFTPFRSTYPPGFAPCTHACAPGTYGASARLAAREGPRGCSECPPGFFCDARGMSSPLACPAGTHSPFLRAHSNASCQLCPEGTFSATPANGNRSCNTCAPGSWSSQDRSGCSPGPTLSVTAAALIAFMCAPLFVCAAVMALRCALGRAPCPLQKATERWRVLEPFDARSARRESGEIGPAEGGDDQVGVAGGKVGVEIAAGGRRALPARELLGVACSPRGGRRLEKASFEILEVAEACPWTPEQVTLSWGGTADAIIQELSQRPTRRLLFAGHADAPGGSSGGCSLGFTDPGGDLAPFDADELVRLLADFFPSSRNRSRGQACPRREGGGEVESGGGEVEEEEDWRGGWGIDGDEETAGGPPNGSRGRRTLRLIFLNGCSSEPLGVKLREHGAECVVCWRTPTHDDLARFFAVRFFALLAQCERAATESSSHHRSMGYIRAFDAAVAAVWSAPTWRSGGRRRQRREEASSQPTPDALAAAALETPVEGQHFSSGVEACAAKAPSVGPVPVLLCDGAEGIEGGGDVRSRPLPEIFAAGPWMSGRSRGLLSSIVGALRG